MRLGSSMDNSNFKMLTRGGAQNGEKSRCPTLYRRLVGEEEETLTLQEKNELLSRLTDAIPDILFLYNLAKGCCAYVNRQLSAALGFTDSEIDGMGSALFENLLHPSDLQSFADSIEKLKAFQDDNIQETEYRLHHANGEWRWFHFRATIFTRDSSGLPDLILYAARDMTEHKKYEEVLRQGEVLTALSRMSMQIAHEINTPLANIKNSLFLLRKALFPDHPDTKYLQWSEEEVDRIAEIVRQISLQSRFES